MERSIAMYVWSDFKLRDKCKECGELAKFKDFDQVCPECGSKDFEKVTARWLYRSLPHLGGHHFKKSEIKNG